MNLINTIFGRRSSVAILGLSIVLVMVTGCKKQDSFLNARSANSEVVPSSLSDYQAILDYTGVMNGGYPDVGQLGADSYYFTDALYESALPPCNTAYIWTDDIWQGGPSSDWNDAYETIEYANIVLDGLSGLTDSTSGASFNSVKGSALFYRAFAYYNLASLFCKPYVSNTAGSDLGLPLRLTSNVDVAVARASVQETYTQVISDLKEALALLPATQAYPTRPSSTAAAALLAKVYLAMADYTDALSYAKESLSANSSLMDFNSSLVTPSAVRPFGEAPAANPEMLFFADGIGYYSTLPNGGQGLIDTNLYAGYAANDLRKTVFFRSLRGTLKFKGTYDDYGGYDFCGIANNEIYLIRAECYAQTGDLTNALSDLNQLLTNRYVTGTFTPLASTNVDTVLSWIYQQRRLEFPFTANLRWEDLRRLGSTAFATTLTRVLSGATYTLSPNDPRYVYPIPDNEIQLTGIQQNQR